MQEDGWLSGIFGYPVYAAGGDTALADTPPRAFLYAKVEVSDTGLVRELENDGFRVVDVNVTLSLDPARAAKVAPPADVDVQPARPDQAEALLAIAESCFRYSRFHLDPEVSDELAGRIKREWIRSYVEGRRGIELLAATAAGEPIGFLAVLESGRARVIDLVGVAPSAQGRGVGSALVAAFVDRHGPRCDELRVGTQVANVPSLRLYARHGFAVSSAAWVLHRHVG